MRILCVCLGNICRSPMAEGALRKMAEDRGIELEVDSAGTGSYHLGSPPEIRALKVAAKRGYNNGMHRARQVETSDFFRFDLMLAMDSSNLAWLNRMCPEGAAAEMRLFTPDQADIPDPYYGGMEDYELALDMVEDAARHLIGELARAHAT